MPLATSPSDEEIIALLGDEGENALGLSRRPYAYATSAPLEEVRVRTAAGEGPPMILKDLTRARLIGDAGSSKPVSFYEPRREIETYRRILAPAGIGPRLHGARAGGDPPRGWLLIEKVDGVELWQIGELATWRSAARWLGGLHARFSGRAAEVREANPYLLELREPHFRALAGRARDALAASADERAPSLRAALDRYGDVAERLSALPATFVHGEFYPSNVLVEATAEGPVMRPVDWEMAAVGPGLVDLAALAGGWEDQEREMLLEAYRAGLAAGGVELGPKDIHAADLDRCRLHLAIQWIGWSAEWSPPPEHRQDWLGEAEALIDQLAPA